MSDSRNLVVCCDGTGNLWSVGEARTNVVKLLESLPADPGQQLLYYDPGVGTPDSYLPDTSGLGLHGRLLRFAGLVWGGGVWQNVSEGYRFLMQNYQVGDRIFLFGFSRGAFTARGVAGLVHLCGLLRPEHDNLVPSVMAIFRAKDSEDRKAAGFSFGRRFGIAPDPPIHFIGVWDTVESVGVPQLALRARLRSEPTVKASYTHVRHAVALDELRHPYTPRLYDVPTNLGPGRTFKQVWFSGAHADVGGGYADTGGSHRESGSSHAALHWMAREANAQGLIVDFDVLDGYPVEPLGRLHDQTVRVPLWTLAGARKRAYPPGDMCVHQTVTDRAKADARYRPPLPDSATTTDTRSTVILPDGTLTYRPVPVVSPASNYGREGLSFKNFVVLLVAAAATYTAYVLFRPQNAALARLQLTGLNGALGRALREGTPPDIGNLCLALGADALFILIYGVCLFPLLIRFTLRIADRDGYPGGVGLILGQAGFAVIVMDMLENGFTALATGFAGIPSCYSPVATTIASFAAGLMSWGKLGALLLGGLAVLFCLLRAAVMLRRP